MSAAPSQRRRISVPAIDRFDLAFVIFVLALFVLVSATFREYAVSNDEGLQHHYGELIVAYYTSGFTDKSAFHFANLFLYGGLFDVIAVLLAHILPFDLYDIRHVLCAFAGIGGVAATWATARMIAGPRAGLLAGLALTLCGVWYGGMFNHTKDVPFAAAMMGATFYLLRAARDLPDPRPRDILWFGTLLGAALGLRVLGLLMVGYAVGLIALRSWSIGKNDWRRFASVSVHSLLLFVPAFAVGYVIMIASWPWASLDFFNPVRAVFSFANFHEPINTIIAGKVYSMSNVPRWYEPCYLAIKLPLFLLVGAGAALISAPRSAAMRRGNLSEDARLQEIGALLFRRCFSVVLPNHLRWSVVHRNAPFSVRSATACGACRHWNAHLPFCFRSKRTRARICCARWSGDRPRLGCRDFNAAASLRIPLLQFPGWRLGRRVATLRNGLLGQYHAGCGQGS